MAMKGKPVQEEHYETMVWVNPTTESLRRNECLCLNCDKMHPGQSNNCPVAEVLFDICKTHNIAMMITRCLMFGLKSSTPA